MTPARPWLPFVVLTGLLVAASPERASAFKRTQTCNSFGSAYACGPDESPKPIAWPVRCVEYQINERGSSDFSEDQTISDDLHELVRQSFETWNEPSCSDFNLVEGDLTSNSSIEYKKDADWDGNMNLIIWRDQRWPYGTSMNAAFALTSVTYSSSTGRIADADIEVNSDTYNFAHLSSSEAGENGARVDILNTLTHEVGHFVGLDHADGEDATMYHSAPEGEVKKRTLNQDDIDGLCAIYPGSAREGSACAYPQDFKPPPTGDDQEDTEPTCCGVGDGQLPRLPVVVGWCLVALFGLGRRRK